ncbi:hypothetical protein HDU79_011020 [Rhizoclosmatium sp. JEL0117]|nr:hypothetical protein HDU79_011020 [Rhizoclosmatium sp. JEL0117]
MQGGTAKGKKRDVTEVEGSDVASGSSAKAIAEVGSGSSAAEKRRKRVEELRKKGSGEGGSDGTKKTKKKESTKMLSFDVDE